MTKHHNLTGALESEFTFSIGEHEFKFRKPTVREMRVVAKQFAAIENIKDAEEQQQAGDAAMDELYKFIEPINHTENLRDLMEDQPVGVQAAFNNMVKEELIPNS